MKIILSIKTWLQQKIKYKRCTICGTMIIFTKNKYCYPCRIEQEKISRKKAKQKENERRKNDEEYNKRFLEIKKNYRERKKLKKNKKTSQSEAGGLE